ncbi:MAG: hypothetical protein J6V25_02125 [Oscillospiraceae bacterium]|nr:hypothetical protein [Oscillospiraceae bacterium]
MILTVDEFRRYVTTDEEEQGLEARLSALELLIRAYTHNNFQMRATRRLADIEPGVIVLQYPHTFKVGDTVQVTRSDYNDGLYTITAVDGGRLTVKEDTREEEDVYITLVSYPMDIRMGVVNLMKWEMTNREKVGVASESISRHSVTYFDMTGANSAMGYPSALLGFLKPYMKARFGQGVRLC